MTPLYTALFIAHEQTMQRTFGRFIMWIHGMSHHFMLSNTGRWLKTKLYLQMMYKNNKPMFLSTFLYTYWCAVNLPHEVRSLRQCFLSWTRCNLFESASTYRLYLDLFCIWQNQCNIYRRLSAILLNVISRCSLEPYVLTYSTYSVGFTIDSL